MRRGVPICCGTFNAMIVLSCLVLLLIEVLGVMQASRGQVERRRMLLQLLMLHIQMAAALVLS